MRAWNGWDVDRVVLVLSAVMYAGIWVQVSLFHWAGGFVMKAMWGPVIFTPVVVGASAAGAVSRADPWGWVAAAILAIAVIDGIYGFYRHVKGIRSQIGGISKRNLLSGPPPILPVAYSLIGIVGLTGLLWNA